MKVALSTISKFHTFELARQMERLGILDCVFTGRDPWRLRKERLPENKVVSFPYYQTVYEALAHFRGANYPLHAAFNRWCHTSFDSFVARRLPDVDVFHALAYCGLHSGQQAQKQGAKWVCDAVNSHLVYQDEILAEEYQRLGLPYKRQDPRLLDYAVASYSGADLITVPSIYARETFLNKGIAANKVAVVPYGVNLSQFKPVAVDPDNVFRVLFVGQLSARKGIHYLLEGFRLANIPNSKLIMVGSNKPETERLLQQKSGLNIELAGVQSKSALSAYYSQADVFVLPSVEDGFGYVLGEAMACGCPVIATEHSGGPDIVTEGVDGFVVPFRSAEAIAAKLVWLYEHPAERLAMRQAALAKVSSIGGWNSYGDTTLALLNSLLQTPSTALPA